MAFSTQQANRARAVVLIAILVVVAALAIAVVSGAFSPVGQASSEPAGSAEASSAPAMTSDGDQADTTDGTSDDASAMEEVDSQYGTAARQLATQYEADPSNPSSLLNLANAYFDWGAAALNHASTDEEKAHARELFGDAIGYYDTYLEENPGAKSATVDRAICVFYSGDTVSAIDSLEALISEDPTFAPAWANLGMFYEAQGSTEKAADAYQKAIDATDEDDAYGVRSYAQERLDALGASS